MNISRDFLERSFVQYLCSELQETLLLRLVGNVDDCTGERGADSPPCT